LNLAEWKRRLGTAGLDDTIERLKRTRTTKNGVFSLKIHYPHLKRLGGMKGLLQTFPDAYFVRISRFDLLGQAISLAAAKQTGIWIQGQEGSDRTAAYDPGMIDSCLREIILDNASWDYILSKSGCRVLHLKYEDVAQNTAEAIDRVAKFLGVTPERFASEPPTVKQIGGEYAQEWRRRYLAEASAAGLMG
jgi:LPS sulfotransferase NodH